MDMVGGEGEPSAAAADDDDDDDDAAPAGRCSTHCWGGEEGKREKGPKGKNEKMENAGSVVTRDQKKREKKSLSPRVDFSLPTSGGQCPGWSPNQLGHH